MRTGLYFDLRNPARWRRDWNHHYGHALELAEEADRIGAGSIWASEHHHFDDGYLPQPLTFLAAVAARTRQARLGTAVLLAPLRHPRHIAEEAAIVDLISAGRLELGIGPGYRSDEFEHFGVAHERRYPLADDCVVALREMWADGSVRPEPVQRPVPLWLGYASAAGARRAGRLGVGLLNARRALLAAYLAGLRDGGHCESAARMAVPSFWVLSTDPERDWPRVRPHYEEQWRGYLDGGRPQVIADFETAFAAMCAPRPDGSSPMLQVVTPTDAASQLRAMYDGLPVEHVFFWASIAGMPDDLVEEHLDLVVTALPQELDSPFATPHVEQHRRSA
jgi:alkanesulfonate monooxygenase SsuD/methylene tetrahydromethanopterin reductase-like flavin-dependent oxidoreductase (luciferase family)